jgi:Ion channel
MLPGLQGVTGMAIDALIKDSGASPSDRRERYGLLLLAILAAFAVQGIAHPGRWEQVVVALLLGATLLLAGWASDLRPGVMRASAVVTVIVVGASIVEAIAGDVDGPASRFANLLLVTLAPPVVVLGVVRSLRRRGEVSVQAVFGVLALYILLGMFFALVYGALDRYSGPFFAENIAGNVSNCLYFSFTTLTTVGFGDITSRTNLGHTLSSLEALTGQIYLVTVVSLLVSNLRRRGPAA